MTALRRLLGMIDATDVALVVGLVLLWAGLGRVSEALQFITVGALLVAYGAAPILLTVTGRRR